MAGVPPQNGPAFLQIRHSDVLCMGLELSTWGMRPSVGYYWVIGWVGIRKRRYRGVIPTLGFQPSLPHWPWLMGHAFNINSLICMRDLSKFKKAEIWVFSATNENMNIIDYKICIMLESCINLLLYDSCRYPWSLVLRYYRPLNNMPPLIKEHIYFPLLHGSTVLKFGSKISLSTSHFPNCGKPVRLTHFPCWKRPLRSWFLSNQPTITNMTNYTPTLASSSNNDAKSSLIWQRFDRKSVFSTKDFEWPGVVALFVQQRRITAKIKYDGSITIDLAYFLQKYLQKNEYWVLRWSWCKIYVRFCLGVSKSGIYQHYNVLSFKLINDLAPAEEEQIQELKQ